METHTNVSYSQTMKGDVQVSRKVRYDISQLGEDKVLNTSYTSTVEGDRTLESFNKLMKHKGNVYQQIGNSTDGEDWMIKEFNNNELNREFKDAYANHKFDRPQLDSNKLSILPGGCNDPKEGILTRLNKLTSLIRH